MLPKRLPLMALLACVLGTTFLSAQVTFTITATANSSDEGYTGGNSYTFIFTADGSRSATDYGSGYPADAPNYIVTSSSETDLWTSITGTGVSGTYATPAGDARDSQLLMASSSSAPNLTLRARNDTTVEDGEDTFYTGNIGLTSLSDTPIVSIVTDFNSANLPAFYEGSTDSTLDAFFGDFVGAYSGPFNDIGTPRLILEFYTDGGGSPSNYSSVFTISAVSISASAVPEPGTYALILGGGVLGLAGWRRYRNRQVA